MLYHANRRCSDWKVPISDIAWQLGVMQMFVFSRQKLVTHPIVHSLSRGPPRPKPLIPEQRTQQLTTPYRNTNEMDEKHRDSSVIFAFHNAEKCYWDRRWHVAAPRSRTRLKRQRWAPLFSAAWLYKSCSAPKTKVEAGWSHVTLHKHTKTHTHTHSSLPAVTHSLKHPPDRGPSQSTSLTSLWCFHEQHPTHCAAGKSGCQTLETAVSYIRGSSPVNQLQ